VDQVRACSTAISGGMSLEPCVVVARAEARGGRDVAIEETAEARTDERELRVTICVKGPDQPAHICAHADG